MLQTPECIRAEYKGQILQKEMGAFTRRLYPPILRRG